MSNLTTWVLQGSEHCVICHLYAYICLFYPLHSYRISGDWYFSPRSKELSGQIARKFPGNRKNNYVHIPKVILERPVNLTCMFLGRWEEVVPLRSKDRDNMQSQSVTADHSSH